MSIPLQNDEPLNLEDSGIYECGRVLDCTQEVSVKSEETALSETIRTRRCDGIRRELLQNNFAVDE